MDIHCFNGYVKGMQVCSPVKKSFSFYTLGGIRWIPMVTFSWIYNILWPLMQHMGRGLSYCCCTIFLLCCIYAISVCNPLHYVNNTSLRIEWRNLSVPRTYSVWVLFSWGV